MKNKEYNIWIMTTIVSFILIFISLISIKNTPSISYEVSIYSATPFIFWIAIISGIFNGIYLIICNIYNENRKLWMLGYFEILFCQSLLLILYNLRGYVYLDRGDAFSYIGAIKDISIYGAALPYNFYPIVSILGSVISQITNIPILPISCYLPTLFFIIYQLSIYSWAKSVLHSKIFILCTIISSIPFFFAYFSTTIYHMTLAVYMLPLFFYLLKKRKDPRFTFLGIILLLTYPFFHPIISFFVLLYLIGLIISEHYVYNINLKKISLNLFLVGAVSLTSWFFYQKLLFEQFSLVLLQLLNMYNTETSFVLTQRYATKVMTLDSAQYLLTPFYDDFIYCILFLVSIYVILSKNNIFNKKNFLEIILYFIIGNSALTLLFLISRIHNPIRLLTLNENIIFTLIIVGYLLYYFAKNNAKSKFLIVICLILIAQLTSILSIYQSPISLLPNDQVTRSEFAGMDWLISKKNISYSTTNVMSPVYRYSDLIYGCNYTFSRTDLYQDLILDDHFGISTDLGNSLIFPIDKDRYLVITKYDVQTYTVVWKEINRFSKQDFNKISLCRNVDKIYSNEAIVINFIHKL